MPGLMDLATFEAKAEQVADTLKAIGNVRRLMLLCKLVEHGEVTVGEEVVAVFVGRSKEIGGTLYEEGDS